MTTPQFDTLRAAKTLKRGGFNETQAETVVNTLDQAVNENLGTKTDLNLLRAEMKQAFTEANAATKQSIADAKTANEKVLAEIDKKFAALYRFLSVFGAALVAIMIALFAAQ